MSDTLTDHLAARLDRPLASEVVQIADTLAREAGASAVLFYGSNLRTGALDGVLDFYVLLPGAQQERIWPRVSYREWDDGTRVLRAKIATLSLDQFARAAQGRSRDTTIWARFVQPSALAWAADPQAGAATAQAIAAAARTAGRLAAVLGPPAGRERRYWEALFRATYEAEFRVEAPGREATILDTHAAHFDGLLARAWREDGIPFTTEGQVLSPRLPPDQRAATLRWWRRRRRLGKALNILRLAKATTTFEGAARYGAWKLERHSGIRLAVTPFRERHPLLAMPGAALELWRVKRAAARAQR